MTKHQKLASGIKKIKNELDKFHQKAAEASNHLLFIFNQTHIIIGSPYITERAFKTMGQTHRCGLRLFAITKELKQAATQAPLISTLIHPHFVLSGRLRSISAEDKKSKIVTPWNVHIKLPINDIQELKEQQLEALLYCPSENEMSAWINWYTPEHKATTLVNSLCSIAHYYNLEEPINRNLAGLARPHYLQIANDWLKKNPKVKRKTLENLKFAPQETTSVAEAYCAVSRCITEGTRQDLIIFLRRWQSHLRRLIFTNSSYAIPQQEHLLHQLVCARESKKNNSLVFRWESSHAIDRQTFGKFICYFIDQLNDTSSKYKISSEIVLLLWIMLYVSKNGSGTHSIKSLLKLTSSHVLKDSLCIEQEIIYISEGLSNLLKKYLGEGPRLKHTKLFSNLSIDHLEDLFRKASKTILPSGSVPALPEAFLLFPHPHINQKMLPKSLVHQRKFTDCIYHDLISSDTLMRQLKEKTP